MIDPSCTSEANQWTPNTKLEDTSFNREGVFSETKKYGHLFQI